MRCRGRFAGLSFAAVILVVVGAALYWRPGSRVILADGSELTVLGVSFGREHFYPLPGASEPSILRALPMGIRSKLGLPVGCYETQGSSFVLFAGRMDNKGRSVSVNMGDPAIEFPDGSWISGRRLFARSNVVCLEFSKYPRTERWLKVHGRIAGERVELTVRNRGSQVRQSWDALPFPQTNQRAHASIILSTNEIGSSRFLTLRAQFDAKAAAPGWLNWTVQVEDAWGNCSTFGRSRVNLSAFKGFDGPTKLTVQASEYLSAGMVQLPLAGEMKTLEVHPRSAALGLRSVLLLGQGSFLVTEETNVALVSTNHSSSPGVRPVAGKSAGLEVNVTLPSLLLILEPNGELSLRARLRERLKPRRDGRTFLSRASYSCINKASQPSVARLFTFEVRSKEEFLEAEVIASHIPAEFYVDAKSLQYQPVD